LDPRYWGYLQYNESPAIVTWHYGLLFMMLPFQIASYSKSPARPQLSPIVDLGTKNNDHGRLAPRTVAIHSIKNLRANYSSTSSETNNRGSHKKAENKKNWQII